MRFMIAGLGSIGRRHLRNLVTLGEKDILLYRTHTSSLPNDELTGYPVENNLQAALAYNPDAVIVANPTSMHLDVAIPAALAGCSLLLEKPVSDNLERISLLQAALSHSRSQVLVGFQFRFHPGLVKIKQLLRDGAIGKVVSARAHWGDYLPNWHPWEDYRQSYAAREDLGGGVVRTLCHPLDYLRWLLGDIAEVWAYTANLSELELSVEDTAEIGLRFSNGILGSVHLDYIQRPPAHYLEIIGTQGVVRWDNADGAVSVYQAGFGEDGPNTEAWQIFPAPEGFERNHMFLAQMQHFIAIARGETRPLCTMEDGIQAMRLIIAVYESASSNRVVEVAT